MKNQRKEFGGLGNQLFIHSYIWGQFRDGVIPDIYLQSMKYWEKHKDEIRNRFSSGIGTIDEVALHIRRGDYLKATQFHANLWETEYYKQAVLLFPKDTIFRVFCRDNQNEEQDMDDLLWCAQNIPSLGVAWTPHVHTTETEDLSAMASCKAVIGANSSFSWWAAFLGDPQKKVIMPREERWFVDGIKRSELPIDWIKV